MNELLHAALVGMSRGLLQYASGSAPWTAAGDNRPVRLRRIVALQQESIQRLCDLLSERRYPITWGVFPVAYSGYNHVSLDFLWPKLARFQTGLTGMFEEIRDELEHDAQATEVLNKVLHTERSILAELTSDSESDSGSDAQSGSTESVPTGGLGKPRQTEAADRISVA